MGNSNPVVAIAELRQTCGDLAFEHGSRLKGGFVVTGDGACSADFPDVLMAGDRRHRFEFWRRTGGAHEVPYRRRLEPESSSAKWSM
jgi:hypothetical protein